MGFFNKLNTPILHKDSDEMIKQIEILEELKGKASGKTKNLILKDIKLLEYGKQGEEAVLFELMNSFMPMLILRDLRMEHENLSAQIDFVVITRKVTFIIECKNLFGDIQVNEAGDFIRTIQFGGNKIREGIYSPITQNKRHLEIIKAVKKNNQNSILRKMMLEKYFDENYKSIIVLANTKTIIDVRKADKGIRSQIIRNDQLISHMKKVIDMSKSEESSDKLMVERAENFMKYHQPSKNDYTAKYDMHPDETLEKKAEIESEVKVKAEIELKIEADVQADVESESGVKEDVEVKDEELLYQELKLYRLEKSREEGVKAYTLFTNKQLEELVETRPETLEKLMGISGFGEIKANKYGQDIVNIISK